MSNHTLLPLNDVNVIGAPSTLNATYSDPTSILHNGTWLLAENQPGYWTASFSYTFIPDKIRLWNADANGSGTKVFSLTPQASLSISNLSYVDPSTSKFGYCDRACPLSISSSVAYQDFFFVNVISMNAFRLDITEWYGNEGGLKALQLYGSSQALSTQSTSTLSAVSSTSTLIPTHPASPSPTSTASPETRKLLSGGAIAGVVVGIVAAVSMAVSFFIFWHRVSKRTGNSEEKFIPLGGRHEVDANGVSRTKYRTELGGHAVSELGAVPARQELGGSAVHELPVDR